jgi:hypothetical protein
MVSRIRASPDPFQRLAAELEQDAGKLGAFGFDHNIGGGARKMTPNS